MTGTPRRLSSRENPLLQRVRRLTREPASYRKLSQFWLEGEHLARALRDRAGRALHAVLAESAAASSSLRALADCADDVVVVPDALFAGLAAIPAHAGIGLVCAVPSQPQLLCGVPSVVLDRVQDAGNVGSILRSCAALGVQQVVALRGTAGLWSPKVLRAGMGAHFGLQLLDGVDESLLDPLEVPLLATSSHAEQSLAEAPWPQPCAWIFGHEGQGIADALLARCHLTLRIPQPGGEESLNVAAAAAICLYESMRRRLAS
jgi:TrmH family RNA methyltransferase